MTTPWDNDFESILRNHLRHLHPHQQLHNESSLSAHGLDSLSTVKLLVDLESVYQLIIPGELISAETFSTVGSLWAAVDRLRANGVDGNERRPW